MKFRLYLVILVTFVYSIGFGRGVTSSSQSREVSLEDKLRPQNRASNSYASTLDLINSRPDLSLLAQAIQTIPVLSSQLENNLLRTTYFLPNNQAFEDLQESSSVKFNDLIMDVKSIQSMMLYHIIGDQAIFAESLESGRELLSYSGHEILVFVNGTLITIMDELGRVATALEANVPVGSSAVYIINKVLIPNFKSISELLDNNPLSVFSISNYVIKRSTSDFRSCLDSPACPYILLAPVDNAWRQLAKTLKVPLYFLLDETYYLDQIIKEHIIDGLPISQLDLLAKSLESKTLNMTSPYQNSMKVTLNLGPGSKMKSILYDGQEAQVLTDALTGGRASKWSVYGIDTVLTGGTLDKFQLYDSIFD